MNFYDMTWLERLLFLKRIKGGGSGHEETTTSNTFVTDMVAPLRKLLLSFAPKQSGSGGPSPTNVRPISGWDGVSVVRSGINIWDEEWRNGYFNNSGGFISNANFLASKNFILVQPSTTYYFKSPSFRFEIIGYDVNKTYVGRVTSNIQNATFTTPSNVHYIQFSSYSSGNVKEYNNDISINDPSTDHDYHAYAGQTYSVSWQTEAGTVYGGTLDMVSGVLTVDTRYFAITALTLYGDYQGHPLYYYDIPNYQTDAIKRSAIASDEGMLICDRFSRIQTSAVKTMGDLQVRTNENYAVNKLYFRYDGLDSLSDFNAELAVNPMQLVASLATPQTYQLTPQQINTLIGTNVITTDANVEEIIYLKKAE